MSDNLKLWGRVENTPSDLINTKEVDGREIKTLPSINRIKKATEIFGVYGKKWGLKDVVHSESRIGNIVIGLMDAVFFVDSDECQTEFTISNSVSITTFTDGKIGVNPMFRKSIESDTINKALSRLGFNADIYSEDELVKAEGAVAEIAIDDSDILGVDEIVNNGENNG